MNGWLSVPKEEIQEPEPRLSAFQHHHHPQLDEDGGRIMMVLVVREGDRLGPGPPLLRVSWGSSSHTP